MKSFKQFIREMPQLYDPNSEDETEAKQNHERKPEAGPKTKEENHGSIGDGHTLYSHSASYNGAKPHSYFATHPNHGGMTVRGLTSKDNHFAIGYVSRDENSALGGDNFYKSILKAGKHDGIESDEGLTHGGASIWHRLTHRHNDVEVTRHDATTGKQVKMYDGKDWHKNFDDNSNTVFRAKLKNGTK